MEQDDWISNAAASSVSVFIDKCCGNGVVGLKMSDGTVVKTSLNNDAILVSNDYANTTNIVCTRESSAIDAKDCVLGGSQVIFDERESNDGMLEELKRLGLVEGLNTEVKKSSDKVLKPSFKSVYINKAGKKKYNVKPY